MQPNLHFQATRFNEQDKQPIEEIRQGMGFNESLQKYAKI
jgi:hypothetical protein